MRKSNGGHIIDLKEKYSNLVNYYIDCIEEENLQSLTFHVRGRGNKFLTPSLRSETFLTDGKELLNCPRNDIFEKYLQKDDIQQKNTLGNRLFYGYPLVMRSDGTISPLFYVEIELIQETNNDRETPSDKIIFRRKNDYNSDYNFNNYIFHSICDLNNIGLSESIESIGNKLEDFSNPLPDSNEFTWLDQSGNQKPSDFVVRILKALKYLRYEGFDPKNSEGEPISVPKGEKFSIVKCPIIFFNPKVTFTNGLLKELRVLSNPSYSYLNQIAENSTHYFIQPEGMNREQNLSDANLNEIFILDPSQEIALRESLTKRVAVITGPPGTGKSQVVCNILVNAMEQGETVLFASKNHKAVNVVKEKLDDIFNDKIIRYGNKQNVDESNLVLRKISTEQYLDTLPVIPPQEHSDIESSCGSLSREINSQYEILYEIQNIQEKIDNTRNEAIKVFRQLPHELQEAIECRSDTLKPEFFELGGLESHLRQLHARIEALESELKSLCQRLPPELETIINKIDTFWDFEYSSEQIEQLKHLKIELGKRHHEIEEKYSIIQTLSGELPDHLILSTPFENIDTLNSLELSESIGDLNNVIKNLSTGFPGKLVYVVPAWFAVRKYKNKLVREYFHSLTPLLKTYIEEIFQSGLDAAKLLDCYHKIDTVRNLSMYLGEHQKLIANFDREFMNMLEQLPPTASDHIRQIYSNDRKDRMYFVDLVVLIVTIQNTGFRLKNAKIEFLNIMQDISQSCPEYLQKYVEENFLVDRSDRMIIAGTIFKIILIEKCYLAINALQTNLNKYPQTDGVYDNLIELKLRKRDHNQKVIESDWNARLKKYPIKFKQLVQQFLDTMNSRRNTRGADWWNLTRKWGEHFEQLTKEFLPIWITVNLSAQNIPLKSGLFDLLVIDEASQCDIASAIPLIFRAKRVVIIGDPHQLKHISTIKDKNEKKIASENDVLELHPVYSYREKSLYDLGERIISYVNQKTSKLETHYRSHHQIISFSNEFIYSKYGINLNYATNESKLAQMNEYGVKWIDVRGRAKRNSTGKSWINKEEASTIRKILKYIMDENRDVELSYGIVTPFGGQADLITEYVRKLDADILVGTVDKFQGDEKDVMIFSPVVAKGIGNFAKNTFVQDKNRINVAVTRAKSLLVIVGDKRYCRTLNRSGLLNQLLEYTERIESKSDKILDLSVPEQKLWDASKERGLRIYPQYPVMDYSLDFAYFTKTGIKWDIEIDGAHHLEPEYIHKDRSRQHDLKVLGWHTKRFTAREVLNNLEEVIDEIERLEGI